MCVYRSLVLVHAFNIDIVCIDQDECALGTHDCAQVCINTPGSYTCSCNPGYELADNNRSCNGQ